MDNTEAKRLLEIQKSKISGLNKNNYQAWQTQTASLVKEIFGGESDEYAEIKGTRFIFPYSDTPYNEQINTHKPYVEAYLNGYIESVDFNLRKVQGADNEPIEHKRTGGWAGYDTSVRVTIIIFVATVVFGGGTTFGWYRNDVQNFELRQENKFLRDSIGRLNSIIVPKKVAPNDTANNN